MAGVAVFWVCYLFLMSSPPVSVKCQFRRKKKSSAASNDNPAARSFYPVRLQELELVTDGVISQTLEIFVQRVIMEEILN